MRTLALLLASLLLLPVVAPGSEKPEIPEGPMAYARRGEDGWGFACSIYKGSRAVHGRLVHKGVELFGNSYGETVKTSLGSLVWRGHYSPGKVPDRSTGWLFTESLSGPPYIRDRYNPKTDTLEP